MILKFNKFLLCCVLIFIVCGIVYAGENITITDETPTEYIGDKVVALEDGHYNITFNDGSNGYCLEYMEKEATKNDTFTVKPTSYAKNNFTNEDVSDYIKTYFIDYYEYAMKDVIITQHTIWHFTDNFEGWRVNMSIVNSIKENPSHYGDEGVLKWNSTHNLFYKFNVLLASFEEHQDFWSYQFVFKPISTENNTTNNNGSSIENNTVNNTGNNNTGIGVLNQTNITNNNQNYQVIMKDEDNRKSILLDEYDTGLTVTLAIIGFICLLVLYLLQLYFE